MTLETLRHELNINQQALNSTDDLKVWTDLMIQRVNLLNMIVDRIALVEHYLKKAG